MGWFDFLKGSPSASPDRRALNRKVTAQLIRRGDDGTAERHVIHYAYPLHGGANREDVQVWLHDEGFSATPTKAGGGLRFEHHSAVSTEAFDALTERLVGVMSDRKWEYDGWECAVIAPDQRNEE